MAQAFSGVRILDFTQVFAGPFGVMQLGLLGAEVIKVEQPGTGDQARALMGRPEDQDMPPAYLAMNLNKKSMTLNLKAPEAPALVKRLVADMDVVVENFKAGTMARLGLDYAALAAVKPDLVYCSVTGYGQTGPKAGEAAYDGAIQAASGMMSHNGHPETGPTRTGFMPVDMATALNTAFAIAAALHRKARTGKGQYLDVSMMDTALILQAAQYASLSVHGAQPRLTGNASQTRQPTADVFPTKDGHIQITAIRQVQVERLFKALGLQALLENPDFATEESRPRHAAALRAALLEALAGGTTRDWLERLASQGIPVADIRSLAEVAADPQFEGRSAFAALASPITGKPIRLVQAGYTASEDGPKTQGAPPALGAHTDEVLAAAGYSKDELAQLRASGVI